MNPINIPQNPESLNEQTTIPQFLRFHWWIVICCLIADLSMFLLPEGTPAYWATAIIGFIFWVYFSFTFFVEIALYYKENGKWQILPTILMLSPLVFTILLMNLPDNDNIESIFIVLTRLCYIAPFLLQTVEKESTQKSNLSFAKKSGCLWTIIPIVIAIVFVFAYGYTNYEKYDDTQDVEQETNAYDIQAAEKAIYQELSKEVQQHRQELFENIHHCFGTCTSAQITNFNIQWTNDGPTRISYYINLYSNTPLTSRGYTKLRVVLDYKNYSEEWEPDIQLIDTNIMTSDEFEDTIFDLMELMIKASISSGNNY